MLYTYFTSVVRDLDQLSQIQESSGAPRKYDQPNSKYDQPGLLAPTFTLTLTVALPYALTLADLTLAVTLASSLTRTFTLTLANQTRSV